MLTINIEKAQPMPIPIKITVLSVTLFLTACVTPPPPAIHVNVDSIGTSSAKQKTYLLLPGNKDVSAEDLQFREFATYVNRSLIKQGFTPARSPKEANVAIYLVYGIGDPQKHQYSYSLPVWGKTGISSSTTYGTTNTRGRLNTYDNYGTYSGNTSSSSRTTYNYRYGIKGYTTQTGTRVTYFRYMKLEAVDLRVDKKTKKNLVLWNTAATSTGMSNDLRRIFPALIAASNPYISVSTGKKIKVILQEDDKRIIDIKGLEKKGVEK